MTYKNIPLNSEAGETANFATIKGNREATALVNHRNTLVVNWA